MCSPQKSDENFLILIFLWIKTNVAYSRLEVIAKQRSALQVDFITSVKLICYFVLYYCFLHWAHPPNMAVGDLDFYYTLYLWPLCKRSISSTDIHRRSQNLRHFYPSMGLKLEVFRFFRNQNSRGSSGAYVTCIYWSQSVNINTHKRPHDVRRSWKHLHCEGFFFFFFFACVVCKNPKTPDLSPMADHAITWDDIWGLDLPCIPVISSFILVNHCIHSCSLFSKF